MFHLKLEVAVLLKGSPSCGFILKILNFQTVGAKWMKFSEWVDIKNKLNLTKLGGALMGFL